MFSIMRRIVKERRAYRKTIKDLTNRVKAAEEDLDAALSQMHGYCIFCAYREYHTLDRMIACPMCGYFDLAVDDMPKIDCWKWQGKEPERTAKPIWWGR